MNTYVRNECVVFRKVADKFGGLHNMAGGYPILLGNCKVASSEALYQAAKFPHDPPTQELIFSQKSPMWAKRCIADTVAAPREDWEEVKLRVMWWCLCAKLFCNQQFGELLLRTQDNAIVEDSWKDPYWGAIPSTGGSLVGHNHLGRLLVRLRRSLVENAPQCLQELAPPAISNFTFSGMGTPVVLCNWVPVRKTI